MVLNNVFRKQLLMCCHQNTQYAQARTIVGWLMYSAKKGVDRDLITFLQQPIDLSAESIQRWAKRKKWEALKSDHAYQKESQSILGPDLATAHFIVNRGGAVKFVNSNRWVEKDAEGKYRLPDRNLPTFMVEGVDASNTELMYVSFDNLVNLRSLQYLNVSNCKYVDDWCIDRLQAFKTSLLCLDVSGCPNITERGLAALHKLNLRCLRAHNMLHIADRGLFKLMLEEMMPSCTVEGLQAAEGELPSRDIPELQRTAAEACSEAQ